MSSARVLKVFSKPSLTRQSFRAECDVNTILRRYRDTGVISHVVSRPPRYGEFDNTQDYQSAMNVIVEASTMFADLPAHVRKRFDNDPGQVLTFLKNPDNRDEAISLGLLPAPVPEPEPIIQKVEVVNPTPTA